MILPDKINYMISGQPNKIIKGVTLCPDQHAWGFLLFMEAFN